MSTRHIPAIDGVDLALHRLRAYRDGRPAILLVHGAFTNHRAFLHGPAGGMAHFLGSQGFDVWLADLRHHGDSAREPRPLAWTFEDWALRDAPAFVARVHEETDGAPLTWLGHSAGGAAGLCWLSRVAAAAPLAAVVTLGTPGPRRLGPVRWSLAATTIGLSRLLGRFPSRALGFGSFDYFAALGAVRTPYLAVAGGSDRVFAPVVACRHVIDRVGSDRKTLTVEAGLSHRGLVLSPKARESCWTGVVAWLKETLS